MTWRPRFRYTGLGVGAAAGRSVHAVETAATPRPPVPDCWIGTGPRPALQCLGRLDADRDDVLGVWLWFTGTDTAIELAADERAALDAATGFVPIVGAGADVRTRLARRIGRRRTWAEQGQWGLWSVPLDELESVLTVAITRHARAGQRYPNVA